MIDSEEAFVELCDLLTIHRIRLREARYEDELFGNFILTFKRGFTLHSLINDRLQLVHIARNPFSQRGVTLIDDLRELSHDQLTTMVREILHS